jgi:hypothetical protein
MFPSCFPSLLSRVLTKEFIHYLQVLAFDFDFFLLMINRLISSMSFTSLCLFFLKGSYCSFFTFHLSIFVCFYNNILSFLLGLGYGRRSQPFDLTLAYATRSRVSFSQMRK